MLFLIEYDRSRGQIVTFKTFDDSERQDAEDSRLEIEIEKEQLLNAALQMSRSELEEFVLKLFSLKARAETPCIPEREAELLRMINQGLPADRQQRLNELIDKRQSYTITQDELQELI